MMSRINMAMILFVLAGLMLFASRSEAIEDFESYKTDSFPESDLWQTDRAIPDPVVTESESEFHGNVLRLPFSDKIATTTTFGFDKVNSGVVYIDFDIRVNAPGRTLTMGLAPDAMNKKELYATNVVWLTWDSGKMRAYSSGWKDIVDYKQGQWQHVTISIFLEGDRAGSYEVNIDGGEPEKAYILFRNPFDIKKSKGFDRIWFMCGKISAGNNTSEKFVDVDNILVRNSATSDNASKAVKAEINDAKDRANRIKTFSFSSKILGKKKSFCVVFPKDYSPSATEKFPVLFFLHGRGRSERSLVDDDKASAELLKSKVVVVLPDGDDGFYINSPVKPADRYNDYLEEVIAFADEKLNISKSREARGICGWSMGGFGAVTFAENHNADFGSLAPIIGLLNYPRTGFPEKYSYKILTGIFGKDPEKWEELNPINNSSTLSKMNIFIITGKKSFDLHMNRNFSAKLTEQNIDHKYLELSGGHSFVTVREALPKVIEFMNTNLVRK